jgi:hypothetical protein
LRNESSVTGSNPGRVSGHFLRDVQRDLYRRTSCSEGRANATRAIGG